MNRIRINWILLACLLLAGADSPATTTKPAPKPKPHLTDFHGYPIEYFTCDDCESILVSPKSPAPGNPWIWRAEFFNTAPQLDQALLAKGYHLAFITVGDTFGAPSAMKHWDAFYKELTENRNLGKKPILEGLSRGGLYCSNWAIPHPDQVSAIIYDNACFDLKSWPGGQGKVARVPKEWAIVLKVYNFNSEAEALDYKGNPIDNLQPLADHHVPLFFLYADADKTAIPEENSLLAISRYKAMNGPYDLFIKHGFDHHPHGLDDPTPIVNFIDKVTATATQP